MNKKTGFTLIELAIVLVIIGIILSIGVALYVNLIKNAKFSATRDIVKTACEAVKGYAKSHYELPDSSAFSTLGVKTKDAYAKPLVYKYSSDLVSNNLCSYDTSSLLTVNIQDPNGSSTTKSDVAFLIYSTGENRKDDTCSGSDCTIKPYGTDGYDDVACFYDINSLRSDICPPKLIISGNLPPAVEDEFYRASVKVSGGVPPYTYTWGTLPCGLSWEGNTIYGVVNCNSTDSNGTLSSCSDEKTVSLTVEDSLNPPPPYQDEKDFTLKIFPQPPRVVEDKLPEGFASSSYNATLHAVGGNGKYRWNIKGIPSLEDCKCKGSDNENANACICAASTKTCSCLCDGKTCTITGNIASDAAGTYSVEVDLTSCQTVSKFLPLIVNNTSTSGGNSGDTGGNSGNDDSGSSGSSSSSGGDCIYISEPTTIQTSGYYCLEQDINGTIEIDKSVDNVQLDCKNKNVDDLIIDEGNDSITIENCNIANSFRVKDYSSNIDIKNNTISTTLKIDSYGDSILIENNNFNNGTIEVYKNNEDVVISNNTFKSNGTVIYSEYGSISIKNNTIEPINGNYGDIEIKSYNLDMENNNFQLDTLKITLYPYNDNNGTGIIDNNQISLQNKFFVKCGDGDYCYDLEVGDNIFDIDNKFQVENGNDINVYGNDFCKNENVKIYFDTLKVLETNPSNDENSLNGDNLNITNVNDASNFQYQNCQ